MEYGQAYFDYQKNIGAFGGLANQFKFTPYLSPDDSVLDFGCGGGFLLHNLTCKAKMGVEISDEARQHSRDAGLDVVKTPAEVPDAWATVIISNHALEHVERPLDILTQLRPKLQPGGKAVFVVPHQKPDEPYRSDDPNQHLYTWNPATLGNLFKAAGYVNITVDVIRHKWPPNYRRWYRLFGQQGFDMLARLYALYKGNYQIRAYAERPR